MIKPHEFDLNDPNIVSVYDDLSLWAAPFGLRLLDSISLKKNINVLDVGFGTGFPLLEVAERLGETSTVYGIDPWEGAIARTKLKMEQRDIQNVKLFCGMAESMPFEDECFDLIISNNGINNVSDQQKVIQECYRVSKTNAHFIATYNLPETMKEFYNVFEKVLRDLNMLSEIEKMKNHIFHKRKPVDFMKDLFQKSGFDILEIIDDRFLMKFADGKAFLNYFFIRLCFLENWINIVKREAKEIVFEKIVKELDEIADQSGEIVLTVPFALIKAEKKKPPKAFHHKI